MWRRSGARQTPRALGWLAWRQKRAGGRAAQTCAVCNCSRMQSQPERVHILRRWRTIRGLTEVTPPDETTDDPQGLRLIQQLPPNWVFMVPMESEVVYAAGRVVMGPGARPLLGVAHPLSSRSPLAWCGVNPRRWQPSTSRPQGSCKGQATSTRPPAEVLPALVLSWGPWTWAPAGPSARWASLPVASWPGAGQEHAAWACSAVARCSMTRMPQLVHTAVHLQSGMQHGQPGSICVRAQACTP